MAPTRALDKVRSVLVRRRDALRRCLSGELGCFNTSDEPTVGDAGDAAVDTDYGVIQSQLAEIESRELRQIEGALERIREGSYGTCEVCGGDIPLARLQALPYATTCVGCQRSAERPRVRTAGIPDWSRVEDLSEDVRHLTIDQVMG